MNRPPALYTQNPPSPHATRGLPTMGPSNPRTSTYWNCPVLRSTRASVSRSSSPASDPQGITRSAGTLPREPRFSTAHVSLTGSIAITSRPVVSQRRSWMTSMRISCGGGAPPGVNCTALGDAAPGSSRAASRLRQATPPTLKAQAIEIAAGSLCRRQCIAILRDDLTTPVTPASCASV